MNVAELMASRFSAGKAQDYGFQKSRASNENFESFMNRVDTNNTQKAYTERADENAAKDMRKDSVDRSRKANSKTKSETNRKDNMNAQKKPADKSEDNLIETDTDVKPDSVKDETRTTDEDANVTLEVVETPETQKPDEILIDNINAEIVNQLASILQLPQDQVIQILNTMDISALQLMDKGTMNEFLQMAFGVDSPAGLLNVPNISETLKSMNELMIQYDKVIETTAANPVINAGHNDVQTDSDETVLIQDVPEEITQQQGNAKQVTAETTSNGNNTKQQNHQNQQNPSEHAAELNLHDVTVHDGINVNVISKDVQFEQAVTRNLSTSSIDTQDVVEQIMNKMKVDVRGNLTEIKITLTPEHLGDVSLKITTQNGIVTAHFVAENQRVKEVIESNFTQLKSTLQQQGIEISSLSVSVGQDSQEQKMQEFLHNQEKSSERINRIINRSANGLTDDQDEMNELNETDIYNNNVDYKA